MSTVFVMRAKMGMIVFFIALVTVTQGPVLLCHATSHLIEKTIGNNSNSDSLEISNAECGLCEAYSAQGSLRTVHIDLIQTPTVSIHAASLYIASLYFLPSFFRARAPPATFLTLIKS